MSVDGFKIALCAIGAFYVFAGYVATRAALTSHFIDRAIAAIAAKKPTRIESARSCWFLFSATLVLAGGVALLFLIDVAAWLFLACAAGQALYLFYLAPRVFDGEDAPDPTGRRQTTNAFVIYLAATAFVVWALPVGKLTPWRDTAWPVLALAAALVAAHVAYIAWTLARSPGTGGGLSAFPESTEEEPQRDPAQCTRIKVMADYHCHPLWALDEDVYGDIAPEALGLSPDLTRDLNAWAEAFNASLDPDDPAASRWSDAEHEAHAAEARPLAARLARECPDRMIYIMDPVVGVVEVKADEAQSSRGAGIG
ncbi:MAG: hypothetical protein J0H65_17540 [Rhizobiales bacterium]|nr:hypothetical protein [Hyphomicrobiales bacterium]